MPKTIRAMTQVLVVPLLIGCGGDGGGDVGGTTSTSPSASQTEEPSADVVVVGTASSQYEPSEVQAEAGTISVALTSEGGPHTFTVELGTDNDTVAQVFAPGETDTGEIELEAGTYTFFCTIPGHRDQGMVGTLTVT